MRQVFFFVQFSFNMFDHPIPRAFQNRFSTQYRCYSVSMLAGPNDRSDVEKGGKIIMPPSALDQLSRLNITYPMLFKLTNKNSDRMTHCGYCSPGPSISEGKRKTLI
uniref:Ubiquitin fusion degradation protein UFD1 N-terminal subdomain 1 domain-containing protein n=1 Tax=Denticeps clupeoides TaxID=299321 RepID=A0AAY4CD20_9TELE